MSCWTSRTGLRPPKLVFAPLACHSPAGAIHLPLRRTLRILRCLRVMQFIWCNYANDTPLHSKSHAATHALWVKDDHLVLNEHCLVGFTTVVASFDLKCFAHIVINEHCLAGFFKVIAASLSLKFSAASLHLICPGHLVRNEQCIASHFNDRFYEG